MNFSIFLIILGFSESVISSRVNYTGDDSCNVCTLSYFRRKRANTEYTRWYANQESTQEFIVKVIDDELPTDKKSIAAVNIQPYTKAQEKVIIGGALIPSPTAAYAKELLKEYTRFVPPTTLSVNNLNGNIVVAPVSPGTKIIPPIRPIAVEAKHSHGLHDQRDESPPASPQFLQRAQTLMARQYAPIAPVSFTRRSTIGPLTPRTVDNFILHKTTARPTRTLSYPDIVSPTRTTEFMNFMPFEHSAEFYEKLPSRTTTSPLIDFYSTSLIGFSEAPASTTSTTSTNKDTTENDDDTVEYTTQNIVHEKIVLSNKTVEKEHELFYNDMFYNGEDDVDSTKKRVSTTDIYEDDVVISKLIKDTRESSEVTDVPDKASETEELKMNYEDDDDDDSEKATTLNSTTKPDIKTTQKVQKYTKSSHKKRNSPCSILKINSLSFNTPRTLHEIMAQLKHWAEKSPVAKWLDITNGNLTVMENPIYMMIVDDPTSGQIVSAKKTVMVVAGIQGRDHHAVTAAMYLLFQLIERSDAHSDLLTKFRFWIIPVFNPDGYDYSMTFPQRRQWSKNLRQAWDLCKGRDGCRACEKLGLRCTIEPCYGVNLDRNFEYQWIPPEELRAEHPCGTLYAGTRQLSEVETYALTHFLHEQHALLHTFIAFKEGDVLGILYPYSHTNKRRALDHVNRQRASRAASAAYSISGRPYVAGQTSEFLPLFAGGIEDWVDGHLGIDNTYTVMMFRPTDAQNSKLATERVVHEAYAAVDTLLLHSVEPVAQPIVTLTTAKATFSTLPSRFCITLIILATLGFG